jgi:hypothetical protein
MKSAFLSKTDPKIVRLIEQEFRRHQEGLDCFRKLSFSGRT